MIRPALVLTAAAWLAGCTFQGTGIAPFRPAPAAIAERDLEVPYVPTPAPVVEAMLDLAGLDRGDYLIDLGSGDGRIPIAAALRGARGLGVDIDPDRVAQAQLAARMASVETRVLFRRQDLFLTPIGQADVIALYLMPLPLSDVVLTGTQLRFAAAGRTYLAVVDGGVMTPDPEVGAQPAWRAQRNN